MNPNTGAIYDTVQEQMAAKERGEPLVPVSEKAATMMRDGQAVQSLNMKQRARIRNKAARASRKKNRR